MLPWRATCGFFSKSTPHTFWHIFSHHFPTNLFPFYFSTGTGEQTCWSGWLSYHRSCFKYFNQLKTWTAAQTFCEKYGGSLAKLSSEEKSYFVFLWLLRPVHQIESSVWIGLSRDSMGNFYWPDGTRADYTNWSPGDPDNNGGKENSTEVDTYSGLWTDVEFDHQNPFVCEKGKGILQP